MPVGATAESAPLQIQHAGSPFAIRLSPDQLTISAAVVLQPVLLIGLLAAVSSNIRYV